MPTKSASFAGVASSAGVPSPVCAERGDRAAMDDPLGAGGLRGAHHRQRAVDVGAQHRLAGRAPRSGSRRRRGTRSGSRRPRAPATRDRSGRRSPAPPRARPGCAGRWWAGPAGAAGDRAPPARAPRRSRRSPVAPVSSVGPSAAIRRILSRTNRGCIARTGGTGVEPTARASACQTVARHAKSSPATPNRRPPRRSPQ